mmetsp:Transcript_6941/g.14754  ORF Transcript_6941/g.14754 Transcript_6941/m.14754 type:complete len:116 (-) Transcript_6941:247-594(-)
MRSSSATTSRTRAFHSKFPSQFPLVTLVDQSHSILSFNFKAWLIPYFVWFFMTGRILKFGPPTILHNVFDTRQNRKSYVHEKNCTSKSLGGIAPIYQTLADDCCTFASFSCHGYQ